MTEQLINNPQVLRAYKNLVRMGLDAKIIPLNPNEVTLFITLGSLLKVISDKIPYENKFVKLEIVDNKYVIVIHLWK